MAAEKQRLALHGLIRFTIALARDADIYRFILNAGKVRESQRQAQFLCGQSPRSESYTELIEQAIQQEGQRFEQGDGMLEFDCFFKHQRRFYWNQRAGSGAARQLLQAKALLSKTFTESDFGQSGQRSQVANAPAVKGLEQAIRFLFRLPLHGIGK